MPDSPTDPPVTVPSAPSPEKSVSVEIELSVPDTVRGAPLPELVRTSLGDPLPPLPELLRLTALLPEVKLPQVPGFVLEKVLGRGGMGVVYQAKQSALNRTVALKMILGGDHADSHARQRFLAEAEAIAQVQHPGIVQVYEFGTHQDCPYFALEYVTGGSLDRVLLHQGPLPAAEAARLVVALAEAVQAAHDKGIVHRDLKPANVLLAASGQPSALSHTTDDAAKLKAASGSLTAFPKITDFGLAKQLHVEGLTASGAVMGTPAYMAPEQAAGENSRIGPATDVYALGAILYECLTGRPPFRGATLLETLQQVMRQEPVPVRQLQPGVPKDMETICHKCLQKEPAKRYASAQALAEDLRNHLDGKPIQARPVGRLERTWKWCRRYPAVAALFLVSLVATAGMTGLAFWALGEKQRAETAEAEQRRAAAWALGEKQRAETAEAEQRRTAEQERQAKELAQERLGQVRQGLDILATIFRGLDPQAATMEGAQLRTLLSRQLERAAQQLAGTSVGDPIQVSQLQTILGLAFIALGQPDKAIPLLERAVATAERVHGPEDPNTLITWNNLASAYFNVGQLDRALQIYHQTLAKQKRVLGVDNPVTLSTLNNLALAYREAGQLPQALPLLEETLQRRRQALDPGDADLLSSMNNLALAYYDSKQPGKAFPLYEEALAGCQKYLGPDHPHTLQTLTNLGEAYRGTRQPARALPLLEQALPRCQTVLGQAHPTTLQCQNNLALTCTSVGQAARAVTLLEQTLAGCQTTFGPTHRRTLTVMDSLAGGYLATGQTKRGLALSEQALAGFQATLGPGHPSTQSCLSNLAKTYLDLKQPGKGLPRLREFLHVERRVQAKQPLSWASLLTAIGADLMRLDLESEAEPLLREALELRTTHLPADHWQIANTRSLLGDALAGQRKFAEAEKHLLAGYDGLHAAQQRGVLPPQVQGNVDQTLQRLIALYEAWEKPAEAAKWRKELEEARKSPSRK